MKNNQPLLILVIISLLTIFVAIGNNASLHNTTTLSPGLSTMKVESPTTFISSATPTTITTPNGNSGSSTIVTERMRQLDTSFRLAVGDPNAKILAKGDVNGDGYEDAVVEEIHCGASCSISLQVVLNQRNINAKLLEDKNYPDTFSPAYVSSSAAKSEVTSISIKNGVISLTGKGLACSSSNAEWNSEEYCTEEKWNVVKTVTYKFDGVNIVQLSVKP